jgi:hypothetical protein
MDLELKHLGQTLAVGGFAVYASLLLVRVCRAKWVPRFFHQKDDKAGIQHTAVYLALTFAAGVVLEDGSKSYVTKRASVNPPFLDIILNSESELRFRSLARDATVKKDEIRAELLPLMEQVQSVPSAPQHVTSFFNKIRAVTSPATSSEVNPKLSVSGEQQVSAILGAVDGVYYDAKNRVYREETYFRELSDISERLNFTRSLTLLCFCFAILYAAFAAGAFIPVVARFLDIDKAERRTVLVLCALFVVGLWFGSSAYRSESISYDMRVFGYYVSLANKTEPAPPGH